MKSKERIVIIGAGPAGMSMAMYLKEAGYEHVTVLEKDESIGGKAYSLMYKGHNYDMGANLTTPRYTLIRPLAKKLGLTLRTMDKRRMLELSEEKAKTLEQASAVTKLGIKIFASLYKKFRARTGIDKEGYAGLPKSARLPFKTWLIRRGLRPSRELFSNLFVAYGYGPIMEEPAAYALKFLDPIHLDASLMTALGGTPKTTKDFAEGFQELFVRMRDHFHIDVKTGVNVTRVERTDEGGTLWYEKDNHTTKIAFDRLVISCPFQASLKFLDGTREEKRLFNQISYNPYFVTAARVKNLAPTSTFIHPYNVQWSPGFPMVYYAPVPNDKNHVFIFYAYGKKGITVKDVEQHLKETIERPEINGKIVEILETKEWLYFPHVSSEQMVAGFYDDLEAMQGKKNTYYIGETMSFPLVELVVRYSKYTVDRFFA